MYTRGDVILFRLLRTICCVKWRNNEITILLSGREKERDCRILEIMVESHIRKVRKQRRLTLHLRRGNPPDIMPFGYERKEGLLMYVTYSDLIQIGIFIIALVGLCYTIFGGRK